MLDGVDSVYHTFSELLLLFGLTYFSHLILIGLCNERFLVIELIAFGLTFTLHQLFFGAQVVEFPCGSGV